MSLKMLKKSYVAFKAQVTWPARRIEKKKSGEAHARFTLTTWFFLLFFRQDLRLDLHCHSIYMADLLQHQAQPVPSAPLRHIRRARLPPPGLIRGESYSYYFLCVLKIIWPPFFRRAVGTGAGLLGGRGGQWVDRPLI